VRRPCGRRARSRAAVAAAGAACAVLLAGCGVRPTSVPVDAGAAPSRIPCGIDSSHVITQSKPGAVPARVYLVCASELTSVERALRLSPGDAAYDKVQIAQALLDELQAEPSSDEHQAGFSTAVRGPLLVVPGRPGDPSGTLRLSRPLSRISGTGLAQIVCTFAESGADDGASGRVVLGGPGKDPARDYRCDENVKSDPDAGVPVVGPSAARSASG
jgi:hypothetical protein